VSFKGVAWLENAGIGRDMTYIAAVHISQLPVLLRLMKLRLGEQARRRIMPLVMKCFFIERRNGKWQRWKQPQPVWNLRQGRPDASVTDELTNGQSVCLLRALWKWR